MNQRVKNGGLIYNLLTTVVEFDATAVPIYDFPAGGDMADNQNSTIEFRRTMFDFLEQENALKPTACGTRGTPPLCDCQSGVPTMVTIDCQFLYVRPTIPHQCYWRTFCC
jgi:hypothetical protein